MAEPNKLPVNAESRACRPRKGWRPFESLRREIDRVFEDFNTGLWRSPSLFKTLPSFTRARSFA